MVAIVIIIIIVAVVAVGGTIGTVVAFPQIIDAFGNIAPYTDDLQIDLPTPEEVQQETLDDKQDYMEQLPEFVQPPDAMDFENPSEGIPIEEEPDEENPVTSDDPPAEQLCDELLLDCGSETIGLVVEITTVDSNGTKIKEEFRQEFIPLAFFGDVQRGLDLATGTIEMRMWIEGQPDVQYSGSGFATYLVNDISTSGATLITSGLADQNGMVTVDFVLPTGERSQVFTFSFEDNADLFPIDTKRLLTAEVNDFVIQKDLRDEFSIVNAEIFSMEIVNSADAITFTNLEGGVGVAYPTDGSLKISRDTGIGRAPKVAMGIIKVTDENGIIVAGADATTAQLCGLAISTTHRCPNGFGASEFLIDVLLARDSTYNIDIGEPTPVNFDITFPLSQKNYDFSCRLKWEDPVVNTLSAYTVNSLSGLWNPILYRAINQLDIPVICNMPLDAVNGTSYPAPNTVGVPIGVPSKG